MPAGLANAYLEPGLTKSGQRIRSTVIVIGAAGLAVALTACESLSPLSREDGQASVLDELNFDVPKTRRLRARMTRSRARTRNPAAVDSTNHRFRRSARRPSRRSAARRRRSDLSSQFRQRRSARGRRFGPGNDARPGVSDRSERHRHHEPGYHRAGDAHCAAADAGLALRMNGAAMIFDGHVIRVVPEDVARASGMRVGPEPLVGYGLTVLPLQYASAANVARTMAAIFTSPGAVVADERSNSLVLTGSADDRQGMIELASSFDVDWMSGKSIGLFPLRTPRPIRWRENSRRYLRTLSGTCRRPSFASCR